MELIPLFMFPLCCFGFSVISDDLSEAREVCATPETDRHQQITVFVYISIKGHRRRGGGKQEVGSGEGELAGDKSLRFRPQDVCVG